MNAAFPELKARQQSLKLQTGGEGGAAPETGLHACNVARTPAWTLPFTGGPKRAPHWTLQHVSVTRVHVQSHVPLHQLLTHRTDPTEHPLPLQHMFTWRSAVHGGLAQRLVTPGQTWVNAQRPLVASALRRARFTNFFWHCQRGQPRQRSAIPRQRGNRQPSRRPRPTRSAETSSTLTQVWPWG